MEPRKAGPTPRSDAHDLARAAIESAHAVAAAVGPADALVAHLAALADPAGRPVVALVPRPADADVSALVEAVEARTAGRVRVAVAPVTPDFLAEVALVVRVGEPAPDATGDLEAAAPETWVVSPDDPAGIGEAVAAARPALTTRHRVLRLGAVLGAVRDRLRGEAVRLELRRAALADTPLRADPAAWRDEVDDLRRTADDRLAEVTQGLADRVRESVLPTAAPVNRLANLVEDLARADMTEEPAGRVVRLRVGVEFRGRADRLLRELGRAQVQADLAAARAGLDALHALLARRLPAVAALPRPDLPSVEAVWPALDGLVHLDPRYQVELPRRSWGDRIGYGRRPVFLIMMIASLVGAAFGMRSTLMVVLSPVLLLLFLAGTFWSFRSFAREREELLDKELLRLREGLRGEIVRVLEQVMREWQGRGAEAVRDAGRQLLRDVDAAARRHADDLARRAEQERLEARTQLRQTDARARELRHLGQRLTGAAAAARDALAALRPAGG